MSFESTDDRIEKLETMLEDLAKIQCRMLKFMAVQRKRETEVSDMIIAMHRDHLALKRFVVSGSFAPDDDLKQQFLKEISEQEVALNKAVDNYAKSDQMINDLLPPLRDS